MASHLFLKLLDDQGELVEGEAVFKERSEHWIELEGYSWSMEQREETQGTVAGQKANFAKPGLMSFSKYPDMSTNRMLKALVGTDICKRAEFHLFEELEGTDQATGGLFKLTVTLTDVRICSFKLKGSSSDKSVELTEEWELDYGDINFSHKNAGANVLIEKPAESEEGNTTKDAKATAGGESDKEAPGESLVGRRDYLAPLGSL